MATADTRHGAGCDCGEVSFTVIGEPFMSSVCYCESCRRGSEVISSATDGRYTAESDGGTPVHLYRKDRVELPEDPESLKELGLEDDSTTRRVVTKCCGTPLFLDFSQGHWISFYPTALKNMNLPPAEMRVQTGNLPQDTRLPDDLPISKGYPPRFMWRLMRSYMAMRLGR